VNFCEFAEAPQTASHERRPKPLRVALIASLEGGMLMSRKPSTAALDYFNHELFLPWRLAPRRPAGETFRLPSEHAFTHTATDGHLEIHFHPERSEASAFRAGPRNLSEAQYRTETKFSQVQLPSAKQKASKRANRARASSHPNKC